MVQVHHHKEKFEALNTQVLVVGFEPELRARVWLFKRDKLAFPFLLDLDREFYRAYELERSIWRSWHPRNLWSYTKRFLQSGKLPERIEADPNQLGGDFVIDKEGVVRLAYYSSDPTDRPSVKELLAVLRAIHSGLRQSG